MDGFFISVEGSDGSGKSTQIKKIEEYLKKRGQEVILTREPGGTPLAEKIRGLLLDTANGEMTSLTEMLLYAAARAQHFEGWIFPLLKGGKVIITDRFTDSSIAYQGYGRGLGEMVASVNQIATMGISPDITFFLDLSPEAGISRKQKEASHQMDRLEQERLDFHQRVYQGYLELWRNQPDRIKRIDANRPAELVFADIKQYLDVLLGLHK